MDGESWRELISSLTINQSSSFFAKLYQLPVLALTACVLRVKYTSLKGHKE